MQGAGLHATRVIRVHPLLAINGLIYVANGSISGRLRRKPLPISASGVVR